MRERGIELHLIEQDIDTATAEDRAMLGMLPTFAEPRCELMRPTPTAVSPRTGPWPGRRRRQPKLALGQATLTQQF